MKLPTLSLRSKTALVTALAIGITGGSVALAQFVEPSSAPTAGNSNAPVSTGAGSTETKPGSFASLGTVASVGGYVLPNGAFTSMWNVVSGLTTISIQQLCVGGSCISGSYPKYDFYISRTYCNGGGCKANAYTAAEVCVMNGYSHLVMAIPGNDNSTIYGWQNGAWSGGSGCTSNCGLSSLSMVRCDNNGTSPLDPPAIAPNNGGENPATGGGGGGGGGTVLK
jgi:hypothetical protein